MPEPFVRPQLPARRPFENAGLPSIVNTGHPLAIAAEGDMPNPGGSGKLSQQIPSAHVPDPQALLVRTTAVGTNGGDDLDDDEFVELLVRGVPAQQQGRAPTRRGGQVGSRGPVVRLRLRIGFGLVGSAGPRLFCLPGRSGFAGAWPPVRNNRTPSAGGPGARVRESRPGGRLRPGCGPGGPPRNFPDAAPRYHGPVSQ